MINYEIDPKLDEYLRTKLHKDKYDSITNIIETLSLFNDSNSFRLGFDLLQLEDDLNTCIMDFEEDGDAELLPRLDIIIKREVLEYLEDMGIKIKDEVLFHMLFTILNSLYYVYHVDSYAASSISDILNGSEDDSRIIFINLIREYGDIGFMELYDMLDEISIEYIDSLKDHIEKITSNHVSDVDQDMQSLIKKLYSVDNNFLTCEFIKDVLENDYVSNTFDNNKDLLYRCLNKTSTPHLEIIACLVMSSDSKNNPSKFYQTESDLDLTMLDYIGESQEKLDSLNKQVYELLIKVEGVTL